jgi:putative endonuclease
LSNHLDIGLAGEQYACTHLVREGYTILENNWRYKRAEVDVICTKGECLIFVEVKTRTSDFMGDPSAAVTRAKQKHIVRAADAYVKEYDGDPIVRFDIIGIIMNSKEQTLEHIEDAFYPTL